MSNVEDLNTVSNMEDLKDIVSNVEVLKVEDLTRTRSHVVSKHESNATDDVDHWTRPHVTYGRSGAWKRVERS